MHESYCFPKIQGCKEQGHSTYSTEQEEILSIFKNFRLQELLEAIKLLSKQDCSVQTLVHNGYSYETSHDKANVLNTYFHDCFNKDVPALAPQPSILDPALFPQEHLCTKDEVYDLIAELDDSKSSGPDGISVKMLKATITSITPSLTILFNLSPKKGTFPADWKLAQIVPVPKSTELSSPTGYRPISILSILSKLIE